MLRNQDGMIRLVFWQRRVQINVHIHAKRCITKAMDSNFRRQRINSSMDTCIHLQMRRFRLKLCVYGTIEGLLTKKGDPFTWAISLVVVQFCTSFRTHGGSKQQYLLKHWVRMVYSSLLNLTNVPILELKRVLKYCEGLWDVCRQLVLNVWSFWTLVTNPIVAYSKILPSTMG